MPTRLKFFILNDTSRKIIALSLAVVVWWLVNKKITVQESASLVIIEVETSGQPALGTLAIRPPAGWQLAKPSSDSETHFWFKGERSRIELFMESEPSAFLDASASFIDPGPNQQSTTIEVDASDLRWRRQEDARFLLSSVGALQNKLQLRFDRRHSTEIMLRPQLIKISGDPATGYHSLNAHLKLSASAITISGPYGRVNDLEKQLHLWENGNGGSPAIFESLKISGARNEIKRQLSLRKELRASGLEMNPQQIEVVLPINLDNRTPVEFLSSEFLRMGTPAAGVWDVQSSPQTWIAELGDHPQLSNIEFNLPWVERHLRLFLPLAELPAEANEFDLPVQWTLIGISDQSTRALLISHLKINPKADENAVVRMTKRAEQP